CLKVLFVHRPGDDLAAQEAIVKATGDAAHAAGIRLAVHARELDGAKAALRAGADILTHSVADKPIDAEFLELAKARKVIYVPTLFVPDGYTLLMLGEWKPTEAEQRLGDPQILAHMNDLEKVPVDQLPARVQERRKQGRPQTKRADMDNLRP